MFFYRTFVRFENVKLKNFVVLNKYEDVYFSKIERCKLFNCIKK